MKNNQNNIQFIIHRGGRLKRSLSFLYADVAIITETPYRLRFSQDKPEKGSTRPCFIFKRIVWVKKAEEKRFSGRFPRIFSEVVCKSDQAELDRDLLE